jgi:hypothetical protein
MSKGKATMKKAALVIGLIGIIGFELAIPAWAEAIIIDHRHTNLSLIPTAWISQAKLGLRIAYQHTSHGSQLVTGLRALMDALGSPYDYASTSSGYNAGVFLNDYGIPEASDLGNPDRTTWATATRNLLNRAGGCDRNVVIWSWCGQASSATTLDIQTYLSLMSQLEADYPNIKFVYMTGHLDGTGVGGNLHQRNEQIREFCRVNEKILFDFADIESYNPDGVCFLDKGASDGCFYSDGNWAQEWLAANPASTLTQIVNLCGSCAHSERLNCVLKGRALWWLLARIAGWSGRGYYVLDGYGGVHAGGEISKISPPTPYFGWDIARDIEFMTNGSGYYVLDGYGGIHKGGGAPSLSPATPYFGFDLAKDLELTADGLGYYVLDGFGGVHKGGSTPSLSPSSPYFGWNIARDLELSPNGLGYYILDGYGGIHRGGAAPLLSPATPYFGFDIAKDLELTADGLGYYVLDGFGGVLGGGTASLLSPATPYFGFNIAKDLELTADGLGYYILDGYGGVHHGGDAPILNPPSPYFGWDIARALAGVK